MTARGGPRAHQGGQVPASSREQRREGAERSNQRFGAVLSLIGAGLVAAGTATVVIRGLTDDDAVDALGVAAVCGFFGAVSAIPGEQMRRGTMGRRPGDGSGLVRSRFRLLSVRVHVAWIVVGFVATAFFVGLPVVSWHTGGWPHASRYAEGLTVEWIGYGAFVFAVTTASVTSLVKKVAYRRAGGSTSVAGGRFWRFFSYQFRLDTWLGGVGGLLAALSVTAWPLAPGGQTGSPRVVTVLASTGVVLFVAGVATATQFRRSGEDLGSGVGVGEPPSPIHVPDADV